MRDSKFLCKIVSLTALKTYLIFSVSTAVVKWWNKGFFGSLLVDTKRFKIKSCTWTRSWLSPWNSGKKCRKSVSFDNNFFWSKSVLFKNKIIETPLKTRLLTIVSNIFWDSRSLFVRLSSTKTWSNSEDETKNNIEVTESKHWNHFCLCDLCPPTSTNRKGMLLIGITNSEMPFVAFLAWRMSWFDGT